jgi:hypothetical protein
MKLKDYITEYVSSGRGGRKSKFPTSMNPDDITDWLEYNGFKLIGGEHTIMTTQWNDLDGYNVGPKDKFYIVGRYDPNRPGTHWIQFGTGDVLFLISTEDYGGRRMPSSYSPFRCDRKSYSMINFNNIEDFAEAVEKVFA